MLLVPLVFFIGAIAFLLFFLETLMRNRLPVLSPAFVYMALLLGIYSASAIVWYDGRFPRQVLSLVNLILFTYIMVAALNDMSHIRRVMDYFGFGVFLMALTFILSDIIGFGSREIYTIDDTGWVRHQNFVGGPNSIAYMLSIGAGFSLFRLLEKDTKYRLIRLLAYVAIVFALMKTISITGYVTLVLISLGIVLVCQQSRFFKLDLKVLVSFTVLLVILLLSISSDNLVSRISIKWAQIFEWQDFYGDYYYYYWGSQRVGLGISAIQIGLEHPFGVGPVQALDLIGEKVLNHIAYDHGNVDAHNSYLNFMAEAGVFGFVFLIIGVFAFINRHRKLLKNVKSFSEIYLGQALYIFMLAIVFANFFNTFYRYKETWIVILLIIAFEKIHLTNKSKIKNSGL